MKCAFHNSPRHLVCCLTINFQPTASNEYSQVAVGAPLISTIPTSQDAHPAFTSINVVATHPLSSQQSFWMKLLDNLSSSTYV
ncbi:hypothetical protein CEXT_269901 [Caerostris extrusa]|uniref:Uncharacterized protein n=1 Tax=Caerostris extrusa TaxID=172846 RepID=A0AAV4P5B8_CAEEX|nr:hypothetical protein CEXT_269901 [Caerostris extrusa]